MPSSRRNHSAADPTISDNVDTTVVRPSWNTSVNTLPVFLPLLNKWLIYTNAKYRTWVQYRYVVTGRFTHARSLNHIDRLIANTVKKGTFSAPCMITPYELTEVYVDPRDASKNTPASAGASYSAGAPALAHYTTNTEPGDELDQELCDDILRCIDDDDTQDELRESCDGSGTSLLIILNKKLELAASDGTINFGADLRIRRSHQGRLRRRHRRRFQPFQVRRHPATQTA